MGLVVAQKQHTMELQEEATELAVVVVAQKLNMTEWQEDCWGYLTG